MKDVTICPFAESLAGMVGRALRGAAAALVAAACALVLVGWDLRQPSPGLQQVELASRGKLWKQARSRRIFSQQQQMLNQGGSGGTSDITYTGEETWPQYLPGADDEGGSSWIVGEHREPLWSQAQTYSCGDDTPCPIGQADKGHLFQRDDNPYVDKREVFDAYGQHYAQIRNEYPWDPAVYPQVRDGFAVDSADLRMHRCQADYVVRRCFTYKMRTETASTVRTEKSTPTASRLAGSLGWLSLP